MGTMSYCNTRSICELTLQVQHLESLTGKFADPLLNRTFGVSTAPKRTQYNSNTKALDVLPPDPNPEAITALDAWLRDVRKRHW